MESESQLKVWCRQAAQGDREAASQFLHRQYSRIFAYLRRLAGNDADAADLTQETFRRVWQALPRFRGEATVSTWIHRIAYYAWVDWVRQQRPTVPQSEHWWQELPGDLPSPLEATVTTEQAGRLWTLVDQLNDDERQAIHLRYGQQLALGEVAAVLGMPLSTLKLRLRTALDRLRGRMTESTGNLIGNNP